MRGFIFVADSSPSRRDENTDSVRSLREHLDQCGLSRNPFVLQYNKSDLHDRLSYDELEDSLNSQGWPAFETSSTVGDGVIAAFSAVAQLISNLEARIAKTRCSVGCKLHPYPATATSCERGKRLADDIQFYDEMARYVEAAIDRGISNFDKGRQRVHERAIEVHSALFGSVEPILNERTFWCALSTTTERFLSKTSNTYEWSDHEYNQLLNELLEILRLIFAGTEHREIDASQLTEWCSKFKQLRKRER